MKIIQDRTGFPMVWVEPLGAYMSWLPVTKIQFEQFLCETVDDRFGPRWYDNLLSLNPRVSSYAITSSDYWRAFITGILPEEAERFVRWMGEEYRLPSFAEWTTAYSYLLGEPSNALTWDLSSASSRCLALLVGLDEASAAARQNVSERRLADQMLLRGGVMEWIRLPGTEQLWGGMGEIVPGFAGLLFDPDAMIAHRPYHPESERISFYGFRLLREGL